MSPGSTFWTTRAGHGLLAGAAIGTLDFLYYIPLVPATSEMGIGLFASSLVLWSGEYAVFALALGLVERRASPRELNAWQLALAIVGAAALSVLAWHAFSVLVLRDQLGLRLFREEVAHAGSWMTGVLYHAWLMLFFGGLIAAVAASRRWRTRMLAALRSAELGRASSERRLAESRLVFLESRIEPGYLHDTLSRLERLYEDDAPAADRLLDELIAFLRAAIADSRSPFLKVPP